MKKKLSICVKSLVMSLLFLMLCVVPQNVTYTESTIPITLKTAANATIVPYAPIIDWRYKAVDGVLYKRLYNYSTGAWVGDWTIV